MKMAATTKSEEQVAKDKEAVARMIGAKSAMEAAQRRIELLEGALRQAKVNLEAISKPFGPEVFINVWSMQDNAQKRIQLADLAHDAIRNITRTL
jgi:hypothetical protein